MTPDPRTLHYGRFYGVQPSSAAAAVTGRPVVAVTGNCQSGSLRRLLESAGADAVLIPPVHELTEEDLPYLAATLGRADVLVAQPVRDNYRGLPLGWRQQAELLPAGARVVRYPVLRFAGGHPWQVIIRPPSDPSLSPPVVAYHDLRTVLAAAVQLGLADDMCAAAAGTEIAHGRADPPATAVRTVAAASVAALRQRERAHDTVVVSDVLATTPRWHTINHPDNTTLLLMARRVADAIGLPGQPTDPGWEMLGGVHCRIADATAAALGITPDPPGAQWVVDGVCVDPELIRHRHLQWYAEHPDAVTAGLKRYRDQILDLCGAIR